MASTDTKLNIGVTTNGVEGIRKLADEVRALGEQGGEVAPKFKELAGELDNLAKQTQAVQAVGDLNREIGELRDKQEQAATGAAAFNTRMDELKGALDKAKAAQVQANTEFSKTKLATAQAGDEIEKYRAESDKAKQQTTEYAVQLGKLKAAQIAAREEQRNASAGVEQAAAATKRAKDEIKSYGDTVKTANEPVKELERALDKKVTALDKASNGLRKVGIETIDFGAAQEQVKQSLSKVTTELLAQERQASALAAEKQRVASVEAAVASANQRNVALAVSALRERSAAESAAAAASLAAAKQIEAAALRAKLATEQQTAATRAQADAIKRAADEAKVALDDAFAKTGVRSIRAVNTEIAEIKGALNRLKSDTTISGAEFDRAFTAAKNRVAELERELTGAGASTRRLTGGFGALSQGVQQFAAAYGLFEAGREFINANTQLEVLRRTMTLATGSTQEAEKQIQFLRDTANSSGIAIGAITSSFIKFQTSARLAGIDAKIVNEVFAATTNAAGQLGLSGDKVSLMLDALAQTASKGVVSMEELRQQLGDSLPGALGITAKGLGITEAQLVKLVESGQLLTEDFLPAFRDGLRGAFGDGTKQVEGFAASWARLKNAVNETFTFIGDSGVFKALAVTVEQLAIVLRGLTGGFELLGKTIGNTLGFIETFDWRRPIESARAYFTQVGADADELQAKLDKANGKVVAAGDAAASAQTKAGDAAADAGTKVDAAAAGHQKNATAQQGVATAAGAAATAQTAAGTEAGKAGLAADTAAGGWVRLNVAFTDALKKAEAYSVETIKLADAKKIEADTTVRLAELTGNETTARDAAAKAAQGVAQALALASQARQTEVDILRGQVAALTAEAEAQGGLSKAKQEAIERIEATIRAKTAEAEKSAQVAEAARFEATEQRIAAQVYEDNSEKLDTYRAALDAARTSLERQTQALLEGRGTREQVVLATERAAEAEALYRDALVDVEAVVKRRIASTEASNNVTRAALNLRLEEARTAEVVANSTRNESAAIEAKVRQKEIEIDIVRLAAKEKEAEARATIRLVEQLIREGDQNKTLTAEKRIELQQRLDNAKAKLIEAGASDAIIKKLEAEILMIRNRTNESRGAADKYVSDRGREVKSLDDVAAAVERAAAAERKRRNVDTEGFSLNTAGNRIVAGGQVPPPPGNAGDYEFDSAAANRYLASYRGLGPLSKPNLEQFWKPKSGSGSGVIPGQTTNGSFNGNAGFSPFGKPALPLAPAAPPAAAPTPTNVTVLVTIGGKEYSIGASSKSAADQTIAALEAAYRAGGG